MRGKGGEAPTPDPLNGITPAYAGKRRTTRTSGARYRDHPRVCGEKARFRSKGILRQGSPPRMRGKATFSGRHRLAVGITPAYAGKSDGDCGESACVQDHPRVCGEKFQQKEKRIGDLGSPPRMRGKVFFYVAAIHGFGITPAYAGKRENPRHHWLFRGDHPRVCGEKSLEPSDLTFQTGSPPRMRGKARTSSHRLTLYGITPAYAGKSSVHSQYRTSRRDHPRVCGEKAITRENKPTERGSPPRMRGKAPKCVHALPHLGITPAYAGKSGISAEW